jgi:S1-C subfamily serine protease
MSVQSHAVFKKFVYTMASIAYMFSFTALPLAASAQTAPVAPKTIVQTPAQARALSASGSKLLGSLVNIVCLSADPSIPSITGTGVMIDPRGIILTAAHVAQLFALQDYLGPTKVECLIRTGSPARRAYTAEPIYISKSWVMNNPSTLASTSPIGTGQYDVALLGVTGTATSTPVPTVFPYTPLAASAPTAGEPIAVGSYGAQYLTDTQLNYSLYPILVFGSINTLFTYATGSADLFSIYGTPASQEGSSGGGIVNSLGQLIGTITTSSVSGDFQTRTLNAVTVYHLRQTYLLDTGVPLDSALQSETVPQLIANFSNESRILGAQLSVDIGVR